MRREGDEDALTDRAQVALKRPSLPEPLVQAMICDIPKGIGLETALSTKRRRLLPEAKASNVNLSMWDSLNHGSLVMYDAGPSSPQMEGSEAVPVTSTAPSPMPLGVVPLVFSPAPSPVVDAVESPPSMMEAPSPALEGSEAVPVTSTAPSPMPLGVVPLVFSPAPSPVVDAVESPPSMMDVPSPALEGSEAVPVTSTAPSPMPLGVVPLVFSPAPSPVVDAVESPPSMMDVPSPALEGSEAVPVTSTAPSPMPLGVVPLVFSPAPSPVVDAVESPPSMMDVPSPALYTECGGSGTSTPKAATPRAGHGRSGQSRGSRGAKRSLPYNRPLRDNEITEHLFYGSEEESDEDNEQEEGSLPVVIPRSLLLLLEDGDNEAENASVDADLNFVWPPPSFTSGFTAPAATSPPEEQPANSSAAPAISPPVQQPAGSSPAPVISPPEEQPAGSSPAPVISPPEEHPAGSSPAPVISPPEEHPAGSSTSPVISPPAEHLAGSSPAPVISPPEEHPAGSSPSPVISPPEENPAGSSPSPVISPPEEHPAGSSPSPVISPPEEQPAGSSPAPVTSPPEEQPVDKFDFQWRAFTQPQIAPNLRREPFSQINTGPTASYASPYDVFIEIWDRQIMENIVVETNRYAQQLGWTMMQSGIMYPNSRITKWYDTTVDELYVLFAIIIATGIVVKTRLEEYWSKAQDIFTTSEFRTMMRFDRFILLCRCLHFQNNENCNPESMTRPQAKLFKIQNIIDHLNYKFSHLYILGQNVALDESLTMWKGWLDINQFIKNKAAAVGIKTYEVCESKTGYLWRFEVHAGHETSSNLQGPSPVSGLVPALVLRLLNGLEHRGHTIWMDNFYNSPALARELKSRGIDCVGTLRTNRQFVPIEMMNLQKKDMAVGQVCGCTSGDVDLMLWRDKNRVALISTYHGLATTMCGDKLKPTVIADYNICMGGVDRKDQMLALYPIERKRMLVWYKKLFKRLLNVSILNAYVIFKSQSQQSTTHRCFRKTLVNQLLSRHSSSQARTIVEPNTSQGFLHYPEHYSTNEANKANRQRRKCMECGKRVTTFCQGCDKPLCVFKCFGPYHTKRNINTT